MCTLFYNQYFHDFSARAPLVPSMARCQDSTKYITHSLTHNEASARQPCPNSKSAQNHIHNQESVGLVRYAGENVNEVLMGAAICSLRECECILCGVSPYGACVTWGEIIKYLRLIVELLDIFLIHHFKLPEFRIARVSAELEYVAISQHIRCELDDLFDLM